MSKFDLISAASLDGAEEFMKKQRAYAGLKRAELENIPESEMLTAVTGWIEGKFKEDWSDMCERINDLPTPCLNLYCADYVAREVENGGFGQAFFNISADFIGAAADGFRAMDCEKAACAVEKALEINKSAEKGGGKSFDDFLSLMENDDYAEADEEFRAVFDRERFSSLACRYVLRYKKYFGNE
ncbi:MAG: DUF4375 domain-containing protein [Oscillospiraceae bacterium]|nr:DUF4375 domain-containing protein [Oscillospiraceae bacterium]